MGDEAEGERQRGGAEKRASDDRADLKAAKSELNEICGQQEGDEPVCERPYPTASHDPEGVSGDAGRQQPRRERPIQRQTCRFLLFTVFSRLCLRR